MDPEQLRAIEEAFARYDEQQRNRTPEQVREDRRRDDQVQRAMMGLSFSVRRSEFVDYTRPYAWRKYKG